MNVDEATKKSIMKHWDAMQLEAQLIVASYRAVKRASRRADDWFKKHQAELAKEKHEAFLAERRKKKPRLTT